MLRSTAPSAITSIKQKGQALVYAIAMAGILALTMTYVFNVGQITNEKTRLQNTTDAAAYSVAVVQARDLNFKAYTNRALVANQVAVAQIISLVSWTRFIQNIVDNVDAIATFFPPVRAVTTPIATAVGQLSTGVSRLAGPAVTVIDRLMGVLSQSQTLMHGATYAVAGITLDKVVEANDPQVTNGILTTTQNLLSFRNAHNGFSDQYSPDVVRNRSNSDWRVHKSKTDQFRGVTLASRDGFTRARNRFAGSNLLRLMPTWGILRFQIRREGGTALTAGGSRARNAPYYTWAARDTLSIHTKYRKWDLSWSSWSETIPMGWGGAQTYKDNSDEVRFNRAFSSRNRRAANALNYDPRYTNWTDSIGAFSGLTDFYDIKQNGLVNKAGGINILLQKPHSGGGGGVKTSKSLGITRTGGPLDVESKGGFINNRLGSMARAESYFVRPSARGAGEREYGSLYNPYWQSHLVDIPTADEIQMKFLFGI